MTEPARSAPTGKAEENLSPLNDAKARIQKGFSQLVDNVKIEQDGWGPGLGQMLDPGDTFTFTKGAETYCPVPYFPFTVGPFSVTIKLRSGEGLEEFVGRAQRFLATIFEAEFELQKKQWVERMAESGDQVPGKSKK